MRKFQKIGIIPNKEYTFDIFIEIKNNKNIEGDDKNILNEEYEFKKINLLGKNKTDELIKEIYKLYNYTEEIQKKIKFSEFDYNYLKKGEYIEIPKVNISVNIILPKQNLYLFNF